MSELQSSDLIKENICAGINLSYFKCYESILELNIHINIMFN